MDEPPLFLSEVERVSYLLEHGRNSPAVKLLVVSFAIDQRANILDFLPREEIVAGCVEFLELYREDRSTFEFDWAWLALDSRAMPAQALLEVTLEVMERAPDDNDMLWLIGDGPLADVEMDPPSLAKLAAILPTSPRLSRVRQLVVNDLHGLPPDDETLSPFDYGRNATTGYQDEQLD